MRTPNSEKASAIADPMQLRKGSAISGSEILTATYEDGELYQITTADVANLANSRVGSLPTTDTSIRKSFTFVAEAEQTEWSPPDGTVMQDGAVEVFVNGLRWNRSESYDDSNKNKIVFARPLTKGFEVVILIWQTNANLVNDDFMNDLATAAPERGADLVGFLGANGVATTVSALASSASHEGTSLIAHGDRSLADVVNTLVYVAEHGPAYIGNQGFEIGPDSDISIAIQAAADAGHREIVIPEPGAVPWRINRTVKLPIGVQISGNGRDVKIMPSSSGDYHASGFVFLLNTTDGATWVRSFPNMMSGGFEWLSFCNDDLVPVDLALAFGSYEMSNLKIDQFDTWVAKPRGFYIDSFKIRDVIFQRSRTATGGWGADLQGLGDGLVIDGYHAPYDTEHARSTRALRLVGCMGGSLRSLIGGDQLITKTDAVTILNGHFERGQMTIDSASLQIVASHFSADIRIPLVLSATDTTTERYNVDLEAVSFGTMEGLFMWDGFEVQATPQHTINVRNVRRRYTANGNISKSGFAGIRFAQADGVSPVAVWNAYSYLLSERGTLLPGYGVSLNHTVAENDTGFAGVSSVGLSALSPSIAKQWNATSGTFFYRAILLYDPVRLIGRNATTELSVVVQDTTKSVCIAVDYAGKPRQGIVRIYRGSVSGTYDSFVDLHAMGTSYFYDTGNQVSGVTWQSRTPGSVDPINSSLGDSMTHFIGQLVHMHAQGVPTVGTWRKGDVIWTDSIDILCNLQAKAGFYLQWFQEYHQTLTQVEDFQQQGWIVGNPAAPFSSNDFLASNIRTARNHSKIPSDSTGLWIRSSTDSLVKDCGFVGAVTGMRIQSGGQFENVHNWSRWSTGQMKTGFVCTGGGVKFISCQADTPTEVGFDLTGQGYSLINCIGYNNQDPVSTDNVVPAVLFRTVDPRSTVVGLSVSGSDASHRFATDIKTADGTLNGLSIVGTTCVNVASPINVSTVPGELQSAGLRIREGTNAKQGAIALTGGTATVPNTSVKASSRIFLTAQDGNTSGALRVSTRVEGVSFTIASSNAADRGLVAYQIFEAA